MMAICKVHSFPDVLGGRDNPRVSDRTVFLIVFKRGSYVPWDL